MKDTAAEAFPIPEQEGSVEQVEVVMDPEQLRFSEERRTGIGGTDAAALVGLHPYKTLWEVVAEKKGLLPPFAGNERMEIGKALEDPVARMYAKREHCRVMRVNECWRHPEHPFLLGHPDRLVIGRPKGVEVKTFDGRRIEEWSEPGEPVRVPKEYFLQCQWYMGLRPRYTTWDLVVLFGLKRVRIYSLPRNEFVIRRLQQRAIEVWEKYVLTDEMPEIEHSKRALDYLREKHPEALNEILVSGEHLNALYPEWKRAKEAHEQAENRLKNLRAQIAVAIGDNMGACGPDWTLTFKKNRDTVQVITDYERLLRFYAEKHGFEIEADDIVRFTEEVVTKVGPRVLREVKSK